MKDIQCFSYNGGTLLFVGIVDDYSSFTFERSYSGIGEWQVVISGYSHNADYFAYADFIKAGEALTYSNLHRQMMDSLENKPFPNFNNIKEENCFFEFGSAEEHFKYRESVMASYPEGMFPVFRGYNHMEYQIRDPEGFAHMLCCIMKDGRMPDLPFLELERKEVEA